MSKSNTETRPPSPSEPTVGTLPCENPEELSKRARKAREEQMVVVPDVDAYGYVPKVGSATYTVATGSLSEYEVNPRSGGSCPDANINNPENGCKHAHRVIKRLNDGELPEPDSKGEWYFRERLPEQVATCLRDRRRLTTGQPPNVDHDARRDVLEQVEHFGAVLVDAYDDYRERVADGEAPPLAELVTGADADDLAPFRPDDAE
jgi:hypothetical protein